MNNNINYYNKYLKYKIKYNALCNTLIKQTGGGCDDATKKIIEQSLITLSDYDNIKISNEISNLKIPLLIDNVRELGNLYKEQGDLYIFCIFDTKNKLYIYKNMTLEEVCTAYTKPSPRYVPPQRRLDTKMPVQLQLDNKMPDATKTSQSYVPPPQLTKLSKCNVELSEPYIKATTENIITDSTNHIKNSKYCTDKIIGDVKYFSDKSAIASKYLENSVKKLVCNGITDNIILVDGLNVIRSSLLCNKVLSTLDQVNIVEFKSRIDYINNHQSTSKHTEEEKNLYEEKSYYLLIHFLPYIITYVKKNTPDISEYKFVICCKNQVVPRDKFKFTFETKNELVYIFVASYGEDDDLLLLLLYSYLKNILNKRNIFILSRDNYDWWDDNYKIRDTIGYNYTKNYINKSILY